ncbi:hypothetical protein PTKIN_Ptkin15bG0098500 [Pterospermum kingtungense]
MDIDNEIARTKKSEGERKRSSSPSPPSLSIGIFMAEQTWMLMSLRFLSKMKTMRISIPWIQRLLVSSPPSWLPNLSLKMLSSLENSKWNDSANVLPKRHAITNVYRWACGPVQDVADSCRTGAVTNVIFGLALGYKSRIIPIFAIAVSIFVSFSFATSLLCIVSLLLPWECLAP